MDPKRWRNPKKQHELLVDARQSMYDELRKYQIEEEMLIPKLHEKEGAQAASTDGEAGAIICKTNNEEVAHISMREIVRTMGGGVKNPIITYSRRKKQ